MLAEGEGRVAEGGTRTGAIDTDASGDDAIGADAVPAPADREGIIRGGASPALLAIVAETPAGRLLGMPTADDAPERPPTLPVSVAALEAVAGAAPGVERGFFGGKLRILRPATVETDGGCGNDSAEAGAASDESAGVEEPPEEDGATTAVGPSLMRQSALVSRLSPTSSMFDSHPVGEPESAFCV